MSVLYKSIHSKMGYKTLEKMFYWKKESVKISRKVILLDKNMRFIKHSYLGAFGKNKERFKLLDMHSPIRR